VFESSRDLEGRGLVGARPGAQLLRGDRAVPVGVHVGEGRVGVGGPLAGVEDPVLVGVSLLEDLALSGTLTALALAALALTALALATLALPALPTLAEVLASEGAQLVEGDLAVSVDVRAGDPTLDLAPAEHAVTVLVEAVEGLLRGVSEHGLAQLVERHEAVPVRVRRHDLRGVLLGGCGLGRVDLAVLVLIQTLEDPLRRRQPLALALALTLTLALGPSATALALALALALATASTRSGALPRGALGLGLLHSDAKRHDESKGSD
jgi:hypothetical protein